MHDPIEARRVVKSAKALNDAKQLRAVRLRVDGAEVALGEKGPVWQSDASPDYNRHKAINIPYAAWVHSLKGAGYAQRLPHRESKTQAAGKTRPSSANAFRPSVSTTRARSAGVQVEISCLKISLERKGIVDMASSIPTLEF